jgi:hypothetical protein
MVDDRNVVLPLALLDVIASYLGSRPYREVRQLIQGIEEHAHVLPPSPVPPLSGAEAQDDQPVA